MATFYDDNFGEWHDMDDPDVRDFYRQVQKTNVWRNCKGCKRRVKIQPQYAYCNSCATKMERGEDVG